MNAKTYPEPASGIPSPSAKDTSGGAKSKLTPAEVRLRRMPVLAFPRKPHSNLSACNAQAALQRGKLENFICAEFIEHDIIFLSELLRNMSINIECSCCTSILEQLMAIRRSLKKELAFFSKKVGGKGVANADSD